MNNIPTDDENQKNDDFLTALGESNMNDIVVPKQETRAHNKNIAETERENLQEQLTEQLSSESMSKRAVHKKTERASMEEYQAKPPVKRKKHEIEMNTVPAEDVPKTPVEPEIKKDSTENTDVDVSESDDKHVESVETADNSVETTESPEVEVQPIDIEQVETKPEETVQKEPPKKTNKSSKKSVKIVSPEEAMEIEKTKEGPKKADVKMSVDFDDGDEFDQKILENNKPTITTDDELYGSDEDDVDDIDIHKYNQIVEESYDYGKNKSEKSDEDDVKVEIVADQNEKKNKHKSKYDVKIDRKTVHQYFGGPSDENKSFKLRISKNSKIMKNLQIDDTSLIQSANINGKTAQDRQDIYLKTVLPTLKPALAVVPFITSGVVITMTAFTWPDIQELLKIEDKVLDLDPNGRDYIYEKNKLFIEKRRKQLDLFYNHIERVSGHEVKPLQEELYDIILKEPDFQQLFFAAYAASFLKEYRFDITCATCGTTNAKMVSSKDLCFLLNNNININQLNYFIEHGAITDESESAKVYKEFQAEKIVDMCKSTYRIKHKLPVSSFIYDLKIPTIGEAMRAMEEMVELFKDKDFSYTDLETGNTTYIDSSFGLPPELIELRKYMFINKLIVPRIVSENKESNSAQVSFVDFREKTAILNSVYSLSPEDYKALMNDENLNKLVKVSGIRHAINAGQCEEETCKSDLGSIPVEPEMLFFIIARQES